MRLLMLMDVMAVLIRKAARMQCARFQAKRIARSLMIGIIGVVFLNTTITMMAFCLYNWLCLLEFPTSMASLISIAVLLVIALLCFIVAGHLFPKRSPSSSPFNASPITPVIKDTMDSFLAGFRDKK